VDHTVDWLSRLLELVSVNGHLDIRCLYGAPWRVEFETSAPQEVPYHIILNGSALLENPEGGPPQKLVAGDIVILPNGSAHTMHDGGGKKPGQARIESRLNINVTENDGKGERLDMMCGRFVFRPPYDRALRDYLPARLVVPISQGGTSETAVKLANLVELMRAESVSEQIGGRAMLNALSSALFTLALRRASELSDSPAGLLALAANPRLVPALTALFNQPSHPWTLPELAELCNMSRATFVRHFQDATGSTASDFHTNIRMSIAARELRSTLLSVDAISELVGYQSDAAFQRAFKQYMGMTPAQWRKHQPEEAA
jgi:AraC family transcriptional activator of mtrCDE